VDLNSLWTKPSDFSISILIEILQEIWKSFSAIAFCQEKSLFHQNSSMILDVKSRLHWILREFFKITDQNSDQKNRCLLAYAPSPEIFWKYPDSLCLGKAVLVMLIALLNHYYESNIIYRSAASNLFVTSKNEFSNSPIHEFKVLKNIFKIKKQG
jgi:hypothetical protein